MLFRSVDELITYRQIANGDWSVALYRWTGLLYSEDWRVQSATLGGTDRNISVTYAPYNFAVGDFDGDGDSDIAFFTSDYTRGATAFTDHGTLFVVDGAASSQLTSVQTPWVTGRVQWTPQLEHRAVIGLALQLGKPLHKLCEDDFIEHHLHDLLKQRGPIGAIRERAFEGLLKGIRTKPEIGRAHV